MRIAVVTVSDRAAAGEYEDRSGPAIVERVTAAVADCSTRRWVVPDDQDVLLAALAEAHAWGADVCFTTGGTGLGPRDITPEVTVAFCDRLVPGIAEAIRSASAPSVPTAVLSRGVAGMRETMLVINLPGSVGGARDGVTTVGPILEHAVKMAAGGGH